MDTIEQLADAPPARGRPRRSNDISVREVVCSVDEITHTIHTRTTGQVQQNAWAYSDETTFRCCSQQIGAEDLLPGDMVTMLCEQRGEVMFVKSVRVHLPSLHMVPSRLVPPGAGQKRSLN